MTQPTRLGPTGEPQDALTLDQRAVAQISPRRSGNVEGVGQLDRSERVGHAAEALRPVDPIAGEAADDRTVDVRQETVSVQLEFRQPARSLGNVRHVRGQLRRDHAGRTCSGRTRFHWIDVDVGSRCGAACRELIVGLQQQPLVLAGAAAKANQPPPAFQSLAAQREFDPAAGHASREIPAWLPGPLVPDDHVAGAVPALGDRTGEFSILEWMILYFNG